MELLILAGGSGSRFGGPKQFEPIDPKGNFIMDYSIYDAVVAGFDRVIILTRPEYKSLVEKTVIARWQNKIEVEMIFQDIDWVQKTYGIHREKPLGTGHAILLAKTAIKDNFCIINADDFYGRQSFQTAHNFLKSTDKNSTQFAIVGYNLENTLSETGAVKRGICKSDNGYINNIVECKVERIGNEIFATELDSEKSYICSPEQLVSMNMICFTPKLFDFLEEQFKVFCKDEKNLQSSEFLIPTALQQMESSGLVTIKQLSTSEKWIGMTYREDKQFVVDELCKLVQNNMYPEFLK